MRLILFMRKFITLSVILVLAGCKQMPGIPTAISPYRIDIQQGNLVTQEMVAKLKPGMTRSQVRFVLGSPLVVDPFRTDRWDYVYTLQKQGRQFERRQVTVIFDGDKLARIEGDVKLEAASTPQAVAVPAPAPKPNPAISVQPQPQTQAQPQPQAKSVAPPQPAPEEKGFFGRLRDKLGF